MPPVGACQALSVSVCQLQISHKPVRPCWLVQAHITQLQQKSHHRERTTRKCCLHFEVWRRWLRWLWWIRHAADQGSEHQSGRAVGEKGLYSAWSYGHIKSRPTKILEDAPVPEGPSDSISCLRWSPSANIFACGSWDKSPWAASHIKPQSVAMTSRPWPVPRS